MSDFGLIISRQDAPAQAFHLVISRPAKVVRQCLRLGWSVQVATRQCLCLCWDRAMVRARQCLCLRWHGLTLVATRRRLSLLWTRAATRRQEVLAWWDAAAAPRQCLHLVRQALPLVRACLHLHWSGLAPTRARLRLRWQGGDLTAVRQCLRSRWAASGTASARQCLHALWTCPQDAPAFPSPVVRIAGAVVSPISVTIVSDADQAADTATLVFARPLPDALLRTGLPVRVRLWGVDWDFVVESWSSDREFGARSFSLTAASPAVLLQARHAGTVTGPPTGTASSLARRLAGDIPLDWRMVDWLVRPGAWDMDGKGPLDLLRELVSAAGGTLTSAPDGSLIAMPWPPAPPEAWPGLRAAVVDSLSAIVRVSDQPDPRDLYDSVTVADGDAAAAATRIEEDRDRKSGSSTEVLVYQVPWAGGDIIHRGDPSLVVLADLGVEERVVADELVTILDGAGRTAYPVYGGLVALRWNAVDLGGVSSSEDGTLTSAAPGDSLLYVSYRTRARRYKVWMGPGEPAPLLLVEGEQQ